MGPRPRVYTSTPCGMSAAGQHRVEQVTETEHDGVNFRSGGLGRCWKRRSGRHECGNYRNGVESVVAVFNPCYPSIVDRPIDAAADILSIVPPRKDRNGKCAEDAGRLVIRSARITSGNVGQPAVESDAASSAYTPNRIVKSPGYSSDRPAECGVTDRRPQAPVEQGRDVAFDAKDNFVELILSADKAAACPVAAGGVCAADGWNRKSIVDVAPGIADETA